jgi:zinc-finger-containing domain
MHIKRKADFMKPVLCVDCGGEAGLVGGAKIYPHRRDLWMKLFWLCPCGAYCGCHDQTAVSMGRPAGPATRYARMDAHREFDELWKSGVMTRSAAYAWLERAMGYPVGDCHIGRMSLDDATQAMHLSKGAVIILKLMLSTHVSQPTIAASLA